MPGSPGSAHPALRGGREGGVAPRSHAVRWRGLWPRLPPKEGDAALELEAKGRKAERSAESDLICGEGKRLSP